MRRSVGFRTVNDPNVMHGELAGRELEVDGGILIELSGSQGLVQDEAVARIRVVAVLCGVRAGDDPEATVLTTRTI